MTSGAAMDSQLVPIPKAVLALPFRTSNAGQELVFLAKNIPALGTGLYNVRRTSSKHSTNIQSIVESVEGGKDSVVQQGVSKCVKKAALAFIMTEKFT